jgi:hypothetical protein
MNNVVYEIDIETFIKDFRGYGTGNEIIECFTQGHCYWFAFILSNRFPEGEIYYNTMNHFIFKYNNRLYDITGDCTDKWDNEYLYSWNEYQKLENGSEHLSLLEQCCIYKNYYYPFGNSELKNKYNKKYI